MPRRPTPNAPLPRRPDRRRPRGNATDAQRRPPPRRRGEVEAIAERRALALELRKAGAPYRAIARQLGVDVHTAHADVGAELAVLRETTVERAEALRDLELERCDAMTAGLWPRIQDGHPPAVVAGVRVSERRARLLGLDEPVVTKNELSGALSVSAEKYAAERELFLRLPVEQLEALAREHQALLDRAFAMARAHGVTLDAATVPCASVEHGDAGDGSGTKYTGADVARSGDADRPLDPDRARRDTTPVLVADSPSRAEGVDDGLMTRELPEQSAPTVTDQQDAPATESVPPGIRGRETRTTTSLQTRSTAARSE